LRLLGEAPRAYPVLGSPPLRRVGGAPGAASEPHPARLVCGAREAGDQPADRAGSVAALWPAEQDVIPVPGDMAGRLAGQPDPLLLGRAPQLLDAQRHCGLKRDLEQRAGEVIPRRPRPRAIRS
jgi:hypothetical protein